MNAKLWLYSVMALLLTGCLSEQERLERARQEKIRQEAQEKEAAQKREKMRADLLEKYWKNVAAYNVALMQKYVRDDERKGKKVQQLLHEWVKGERGDSWSNAELQTGAAELEAFGLKYMPNAYSQYEKVRDAALECQQVFEENFSKFEDPEGEKWATFKSALTAFSNARTQSLRRKAELSHYYLLYKVGAITPNELLEIDQKPIVLWLLEKEPVGQDIKSLPPYAPLDEKSKAFVAKFMVETAPVIERLEARCKVTKQLFDEVCAAMKMFGYLRYDLSKMACWEENRCIVQELTKANAKIKEWHLKYKMMTLNSAELTQKDEELSKHLKGLEAAIKDYVKIRARGPLFPPRRLLDAYYDGKYVRAWQFQALGFYGVGPGGKTTEVDADVVDSLSGILVGCEYRHSLDVSIDMGVFPATMFDRKNRLDDDLSRRHGIWRDGDLSTDYHELYDGVSNYYGFRIVCDYSNAYSFFKFNDGLCLKHCYGVYELVRPLCGEKRSLSILALRALEIDNKIYGFESLIPMRSPRSRYQEYKVEVCQ